VDEGKRTRIPTTTTVEQKQQLKALGEWPIPVSLLKGNVV